jgi:hypothetical protein
MLLIFINKRTRNNSESVDDGDNFETRRPASDPDDFSCGENSAIPVRLFGITGSSLHLFTLSPLYPQSYPQTYPSPYPPGYAQFVPTAGLRHQSDSVSVDSVQLAVLSTDSDPCSLKLVTVSG